MPEPSYSMEDYRIDAALLPAGACGIDAGLTLLKTALAVDGGVAFAARESASGHADAGDARASVGALGVTGAGARRIARPSGAVDVQEIDAAARGCRALLALDGRDAAAPFLMALLGTGTAFAVVRGDDVRHLGGCAVGGGSFAGIARRIDGGLTYDAMVTGASRGDRRTADIMVSDAYPEGIGRIGPDLTAAHLAAAGEAPLDDVLAALLNMHGETIGQIGASRARMASVDRMVLCGGFAHANPVLVESIARMAGLFGVTVELAPHAGYAGALGAALIAAAQTEARA